MENEKHISVKVEGMTCGNCALTISKYLDKNGVKNVAANAGNGEVTFTIVDGTDEHALFEGINGLGYHVVDEAEANAEHHHHGGSSLKIMLIISIILSIPLILHMFVGEHHFLNNPWLQLALSLPVYGIGVYHFGTSAYRSLKNGIANMDVLIIMGASAAFIYSLIGLFFYKESAHIYLFFETAATIITFVLLGDFIEERTMNATTSSIKALMQLQPSFSKLITIDNSGKEVIKEVETKSIQLNDVILVNDGDSVPVDGIVLSGDAEINESMFSGESLPVHKKTDDEVTGGTVLNSGLLRIKATAVGQSTVLSEIIRMVQQAQGTKPPMQKLADKISAVFVPVVLVIAAITFFLNYFFGNFPEAEVFSNSIMRSIAVLVIACPCAMGLATPAAVAVGLGRAARNGILIKGGDTLERFKDIRQIVFDKTGTLTTGQLTIKSYEFNGIEEDAFKSIVKSIETFSSHPIAKSIVNQWKDVPNIELKNVEEVKGYGLKATDQEGNEWKLGSQRWMKEADQLNAKFDFHLEKNGQWMGGLEIMDELRTDAKETIDKLHEHGFKTIIISGDREQKAQEIGKEIGIDLIYAEQSPAQKMEHLEELIKTAPTIMVGDGINDAPALAKADIGVSLSDSTHVAMQSASVILSNNKLNTLPRAIRLGKMTYQTIKQNLFWAFFYNVLFIPFAALGYLHPMWAALIMAMSDVVLVANSLRLNIRKLD